MQKIYLNSMPARIFDPAFPLPNISFINHVADEPDWKAGPVKHTDWCEVIYVNRGRAVYKINHKQHTVSAGDIVLFNQGIIHEGRTDAEDPVERWACGFSDLHMAGRPVNHIVSDEVSPVISVGEKGGQIAGLFQMIMDAVLHPSANSYNLCQFAVCTVLAYVDDIVRELPRAFYAGKETLAQEIVAYIDDHYTEPLTLGRLSRHFFISPDYLSHIVKREYGFSPIDYLLNRRIGESIRLLMSTNFSIQTIAEMVGYPDMHHFSTAFRKKMGTSPSLYRKTLYMHSTPRTGGGSLQLTKN